MTMKEAAQAALDVQSAVNLSGVVRSFAEITSWMRTELKLDTRGCNQHPISRLFAEQITWLTVGVSIVHDGENRYDKAYDWCDRTAKGEEVPLP